MYTSINIYIIKSYEKNNILTVWLHSICSLVGS